VQKKIAVSLTALVLLMVSSVQAEAVTLQLNPKIGACYLFNQKELEAISPLTNPISCAKPHNAETFWVGRWTLKSQPWNYTDEKLHAAVDAICIDKWDFPDDSNLNYWAFFTPSPAQWAKGARWVRCDAMSQIAKKGTFNQMYATWSGNAGLNSGYTA
jgi:hypothetical protein